MRSPGALLANRRGEAPTPLHILAVMAGVAVLLVLGPACGIPVVPYHPPPPPPPPQIPSVDLQLDERPVGTITSIFGLNNVAFAPGANRLFLASGRSLAIVDWHNSARQKTLAFDSAHSRITALSPRDDGERLAIGLADGIITVVETKAFVELGSLGTPSQVGIRQLAFSPDSIHIASTTKNSLEVWETATGKKLFSNVAHTENINSLAYSPDGNLLATGGDDRSVRVWNAATGELLSTFFRPNSVLSVAFSPDGRLLASSGVWGLTVTDLKNTVVFDSLEPKQGVISNLAFSKDGYRLFASSDLGLFYSADRGVVLEFDLTRKSRTTGFPAHSGYIDVLQLSPDGKLLVTAGTDAYIRLWRID